MISPYILYFVNIKNPFNIVNFFIFLYNYIRDRKILGGIFFYLAPDPSILWVTRLTIIENSAGIVTAV
jgi:hypothetical protein